MAQPTPGGAMDSPGGAALARLEWVAGAILTLLALWGYGERLLFAGGLWRDEAAALHLATLPSLADVFRLFPHEAFPLAVPLALRLWTALGGQGDHALRLFGFAVGVALVAALWASAWITARTPPLVGLALLAPNAAFLVWSSEVRGYGLGSCCVVASFAALAALLARPRRWTGVMAGVALLGAVHCLLGNAALVAALCTAAALVAGRPRRRLALLILGLGALAAVSLLPYAGPLAEAQSWKPLVEYPSGFVHELLVLAATCGPGWAPWAWLLAGVAGLALTVPAGRRALAVWFPAARRPPELPPAAVQPAPGAARPAVRPGDLGEAGSRDAIRLFAALAALGGLAAHLVFLRVLSYTPRAWYYLPLLALVAAALEPLCACGAAAGAASAASAAGGRPAARGLRLAACVLGAAFLLPAAQPRLVMRLTNVDLVAARLAAQRAPADLVVVCPWYRAISFTRYVPPAWQAPPAAPWVTLPNVPDHRMHRYDLLKARLAAHEPIADVLGLVAATLRAGHRVWIVGQLRVPPPGRPAPVLPPAPQSPFGWMEDAYMQTWMVQLGAYLQTHAAALERLPVAAPTAVSQLEDDSLYAAAGWRDGG